MCDNQSSCLWLWKFRGKSQWTMLQYIIDIIYSWNNSLLNDMYLIIKTNQIIVLPKRRIKRQKRDNIKYDYFSQQENYNLKTRKHPSSRKECSLFLRYLISIQLNVLDSASLYTIQFGIEIFKSQKITNDYDIEVQNPCLRYFLK